MKQSIPLVVGNWKLNPNTSKDATALAQAIIRVTKKYEAPYIAIAPPFVYLESISKKLTKSPVALAAQDVSDMPLGPFTGDISVSQLKDLEVSMVIIGHSERRAKGESNDLVAKKVQQALRQQIIPIVCIGERERDEQGHYLGFIEEQLTSLVKSLTTTELKKVIIAYEPIWAIGTGKTATAEDVREMQLFIESTLTKLTDRATAKKVRLLYGGSVKPHNAFALQTEGGMQGFLVGGASLKAEDFLAIIQATKEAI